MKSRNAFLGGIVIVVLSIAALAAFAVWEEWLNLIVGLWLIVSPWVLKFQGTHALRVDVVIGIIVAVLAAIELWMMSQDRMGGKPVTPGAHRPGRHDVRALSFRRAEFPEKRLNRAAVAPEFARAARR